MQLTRTTLGVAAALVASAATQSSLALAPATTTTTQWQKLFPQEMYEYLQCQVCQTPELSGSVGDSGCNYETVDKAVAQHFHPLLMELSQLTFFRYFKVDLGRECPFWQDDGMCASRDCAVCECPKDEIPPAWFQMDQQERAKAPPTKHVPPSKPCDDQTGESELSRVDRKNAAAGESFNKWTETSSPEVWTSPSDSDDNMVYINLLENPERFTGYSGYQAERIWKAIYQENCFTPPSGQEKELSGMCLEERVYYRLISGLQSSINTHIALRYKHGNYWGPNLGLFVERVGKHPQRLQNLYFTYLFVMRALGRYRSELLSYDYVTGNEEDDARVRSILRQLVVEDTAASACPAEQKSVLSGFDERALFQVKRGGMSYDEFVDAKEQKRELERQFREKFQNISRIMDCVTCEKCRLWGKLQVTGLGTAIKILLADDVRTISPLHRNELIALVNIANNLARSVDAVHTFRDMEFTQAMQQLAAITVAAIVGVIALVLFIRKGKSPVDDSKKTN